MKLTKGGHAPVPTSLLTVVLSWQSDHEVDAHALLLGADGRVRSDRDFVFFNAPRHVSQAVTLDPEPAPGTARLSVSLPRTEAEVARIALTGSVDAGAFGKVAGLVLTVFDHHRPVAWFEIAAAEAVRAMLFGEFYRRDGEWRFRAVGQGWASGLAGIVTEFGVRVDDPGPGPAGPGTATRGGDAPGSADRSDTAAPPPPAGTGSGAEDPARGGDSGTPRRRGGFTLERPGHGALARPAPPARPEFADWHADPDQPQRLRWWNGTEWTQATRPAPPADARHCPRCGAPRRWRLFGGPALCRDCATEIETYLAGWRGRAERVLRTVGVRGDDWAGLWTALRYQRIDRTAGLEALRAAGHDHVERRVAFAFADGAIEQAELDGFEETVAELALTGPLIEDLRRRMSRGRMLTRLRAGELPVLPTPGLHLDPGEQVHLNVPAIHIRQLARGPKLTEGRLICSNKKLRFTGADTGTEMPWARVVSVVSEGGKVAIAATSARGGAVFEVADPDHVAATLEGALRVAKRLALSPGRRDTRSISQEIKAQVWQRDGGKCVECGESHYLEFDHIIPISRGGATSAANLQILCRACNRVKGARI
ncbi:TerD family protein [Nocardia yamanashiensis]|uniref:TerD family protein n=1 Tax=Nocardia yamanashiensis TaxID=209247 RepID=UPI001E4146B8|nr:TerD family protein [Nocardia yamanashiensis]UGT45192.1 TerD family protein [Nocardia yamanashiensis]